MSETRPVPGAPDPDHEDAIAWYTENGDTVADGYERLDPRRLYGWISDLFPPPPAAVLDVGAGTGRDAAWLTSLRYDVTAAEPSDRMRRIARNRHPEIAIRWMADKLPDLADVHRLRQRFELVVANAVWMHIAPEDREMAFGSLVSLAAPGGLIVLSIRHGRREPGRGMHPASREEIDELSTARNARIIRWNDTDDQRGRQDLRWTQIAVRASGRASHHPSPRS